MVGTAHPTRSTGGPFLFHGQPPRTLQSGFQGQRHHPARNAPMAVTSACAALPLPTLRRWLPRPRFSLRVLLIALTVFAIGFPIWYRWPYGETEMIYRQVGGIPNNTLPPLGRIVKIWQRQWGGGRLQHGPMTVYSENGEVAIQYYDKGQPTGRSLAYWNGKLR